MDSQSQKYSSLIQKTDEKAVVEALLHDKQLFENPELIRKVAFDFTEVFPSELFEVTEEVLDFIKSMDAQVRMDSQTKEVKGA